MLEESALADSSVIEKYYHDYNFYYSTSQPCCQVPKKTENRLLPVPLERSPYNDYNLILLYAKSRCQGLICSSFSLAFSTLKVSPVAKESILNSLTI